MTPASTRPTATAAGPPAAACPPNVRAAFVRACGMADDTAVAWLDAVHPAWEGTWRRCGTRLLTEVGAEGRTELADRLAELFGRPGAPDR